MLALCLLSPSHWILLLSTLLLSPLHHSLTAAMSITPVVFRLLDHISSPSRNLLLSCNLQCDLLVVIFPFRSAVSPNAILSDLEATVGCVCLSSRLLPPTGSWLIRARRRVTTLSGKVWSLSRYQQYYLLGGLPWLRH